MLTGFRCFGDERNFRVPLQNAFLYKVVRSDACVQWPIMTHMDKRSVQSAKPGLTQIRGHRDAELRIGYARRAAYRWHRDENGHENQRRGNPRS